MEGNNNNGSTEKVILVDIGEKIWVGDICFYISFRKGKKKKKDIDIATEIAKRKRFQFCFIKGVEKLKSNK